MMLRLAYPDRNVKRGRIMDRIDREDAANCVPRVNGGWEYFTSNSLKSGEPSYLNPAFIFWLSLR
jgi:hypothetical protein